MRNAPLLAVPFIIWSMLAPWAAAFPSAPDHYKVSLFGVRRISDMSPSSRQERCGWNDPAAPCQPATNGRGNYIVLTTARWLIIAALVAVVLRRRSASAFAAVLIGAAIIVVRMNVASALRVFAEATTVSVVGSGIIAAAIATALCIAAVAIGGNSRIRIA